MQSSVRLTGSFLQLSAMARGDIESESEVNEAHRGRNPIRISVNALGVGIRAHAHHNGSLILGSHLNPKRNSVRDSPTCGSHC